MPGERGKTAKLKTTLAISILSSDGACGEKRSSISTAGSIVSVSSHQLCSQGRVVAPLSGNGTSVVSDSSKRTVGHVSADARVMSDDFIQNHIFVDHFFTVYGGAHPPILISLLY
jgi:hypothetical protein